MQDIIDATDDSDEGYFVMVDIEYPTKLHDLHNDFPLAAKMKIGEEFLSSYEQQFNQPGTKTEKQLETLFSKTEYVCHYSMLKFLVEQGLIITKLHKVLRFRQSDFLKVYIDMNTRLRQEIGISEFKKNFFKLLINSCFGKTMENLRRRQKLIMVTNEHQAYFYCNKFNFNKFKIFKDDMVAVSIFKKNYLLE